MKCSGMLMVAVLMAALSASAMPPRPGVRPPGALLDAIAAGRIDNPAQGLLQAQRAKGGPPKISGSRSYPVILGFFSDTANTFTTGQFQDMLFGSGAGDRSVNNYYRDMSYNAMSCSGSVAGWYTAANTMAHYGNAANGLTQGTTKNVYEFIRTALTHADSFVNFSLPGYDLNNDGYVDVVWVVHAGRGGEEELPNNGNWIWSHSSSLSNWGGGATYFTTNDPWPGHSGQYMRIDKYIIMPEKTLYADGNAGTVDMIGCGVFAHEFGHALGLPDMYDVAMTQTSAITGQGLGLFSLMAAGSWGGDYLSEAIPVALDLWCRRFLGWASPIVVAANGQYTVHSVMSTPVASSYKLAKQGQDTTRQYWLMENRYKLAPGPVSAVKWDSLMVGQGLAIYHVDTVYTSGSYFNTNHVNSNSTDGISRNRPYGVALEETDQTGAGYASDLWTGGINNGEAADLWNSSTQTSFDSTGPSYPVSFLNDGTTRTDVAITGIPAASAAMTCNMFISASRPDLGIALLQNPAFTYDLGISLVSHFALLTPNNLDTANLAIDADPPVRLNFFHPSASTFQASYILQKTGSYKIRIAAKDSDSTAVYRTGERSFAVSAAKAAGGSVSALGGAVSLEFPAGAVANDELWVICENRELSNPGAVAAGPAFQVGPNGRMLAAAVELTLRYDPALLAGRDPARLAVCELVNGQWRSLGGRLDAARHEVTAAIGQAGVYQLCWSGSFPVIRPVAAAMPVTANPSPFARATSISYQLGAPSSVSLRVYNVAGQLVRTLRDGYQEAGRHTEVWDGRSDRDGELPSGVYYVRLRYQGHDLTGRVVKVQ